MYPLTLALLMLNLNGETYSQSVVGFGWTYIVFVFGYV